MAQVVKSTLFIGLVVCWVAFTFIVAIGFLPKRPDSCAFFISQGFMIPALVLQTKYREKFGQLGTLLMGAAAGCIVVCVLLFFFGGFRAAAIIS